MPTETIFPNSEQEWLDLRTLDITSTDVSALFGISPYCTEFEMWHRKKNRTLVDFKTNERVEWGKKLQDTIALGVAQEQGWKVRRMDEYMRDPELRIGASFDFSIEGGNGILEVKNVDSLQFKRGWIENDDKSIEAPPHIELQVQHQMAVSNRDYAFLAAFVGGNRVVLIRREPDLAVISAVKKRVAEFWKSIEDGIEPKPDYARDSAMIAKLYGYAEPGKVVEATASMETLAEGYLEINRKIKALETAKAEAKAKILIELGSAEKAYSSGFTISAGMIGPCHVEYDRAGYRNFKVTPKNGGR